MRAHPCHVCPDREKHARWAERWWKLKRETDALSQQITSRTGAIARVFDRVTDVLLGYGYLVEHETGRVALSESGRILRRIYADRDLLVAESLRRGLWNGLDAASLAAMACALVFEPRRDEGLTNERYLPKGPFRPALEETQELWSRLDDLERDNALPGSNPLAVGLNWPWNAGPTPGHSTRSADRGPGRGGLRPVDQADHRPARSALGRRRQPVGPHTARQAMDAIHRGIVAYSSSLTSAPCFWEQGVAERPWPDNLG